MIAKLGFSSSACPEWGLYGIAINARLFGFAGVEIRMHNDNRHFSAQASPGEAALIGRVFRRSGVSIFSIASSYCLATADTAEHLPPGLKHKIDLAHQMGAAFLRVRLPKPGLENVHTVLASIAPVLKASAEYAASRNVALAIESKGPWAKDKRLLALGDRLSVLSGAKILLNVRSVCLGNPRSWKRVCREILPHVAYLRVSDGYRTETHSTHLAPIGCGEVPVKSAIQLVKKLGFRGFINFEWDRVGHPELEQPEVALPRFSHAILRYWRVRKRHSILV